MTNEFPLDSSQIAFHVTHAARVSQNWHELCEMYVMSHGDGGNTTNALASAAYIQKGLRTSDLWLGQYRIQWLD